MNTTFIISGGAGRVINSIPALEKYEKLNPNDDFRIIVHGWEPLFWSHPTLQQKVFGAHQKGNFEQHILKNKVIVPEPYVVNNFYNQKCNLVEAFDECINNTTDHSDLNYDVLHLRNYEQLIVKDVIKSFKEKTKKQKIVVFQPFGSSAELFKNKIVDRSNRSMISNQYLQVVREISKHAVVLYVGSPELRHPNDNISIPLDEYQPYLRTIMSVISQCDFFVGICSVGQHMARAFNKQGLVLMGATLEQNFSYPNHFKIFRKEGRIPYYTPWRLSEVDCEFSDRMNEGIMHYTEEELDNIIDIIKSGLSETKTLDTAKNTFLNGQYN